MEHVKIVGLGVVASVIYGIAKDMAPAQMIALTQRSRFLIGAFWGRGLGTRCMRPRQESNLRTRLRRPALYPLSYGGALGGELYPAGGGRG